MTKSGNPSSNRKKRNQLEVLFEISQEIQACTEEEDTYRSVLELMEELVDFESAALFVYDSRVDELKMAAGRGEMVDLIKPASFDMDQGLSAWVAKREKAVLLSEVHKGESPLKSPVRSFLSIPLHLGDRLAGVINFGHTRAGHFTREHLKVLSIAARSLSAVIERGHYSRELERLNNELDEKSSQLESEGKTHPGYNRFLAIGEVAARFNHDLNNLLTIVMGNAQLLRDDLEGADEIIVKKVDNIISESRRIAQIAMEIRRTGKKFNKKDLQAGSPEKRDS